MDVFLLAQPAGQTVLMDTEEESSQLMTGCSVGLAKRRRSIFPAVPTQHTRAEFNEWDRTTESHKKKLDQLVLLCLLKTIISIIYFRGLLKRTWMQYTHKYTGGPKTHLSSAAAPSRCLIISLVSRRVGPAREMLQWMLPKKTKSLKVLLIYSSFLSNSR